MTSFEPDYVAITREAWTTSEQSIPDTSATRRVIESYRRQRAEAGIAEVNKEDLRFALDALKTSVLAWSKERGLRIDDWTDFGFGGSNEAKIQRLLTAAADRT
jgi:hypothetical protein